VIEADARVIPFAGQDLHNCVEPHADKSNNQVGVPGRRKGLIPEDEADGAKNSTLPGAAHRRWIDGDSKWVGSLWEIHGLKQGSSLIGGRGRRFFNLIGSESVGRGVICDGGIFRELLRLLDEQVREGDGGENAADCAGGGTVAVGVGHAGDGCAKFGG